MTLPGLAPVATEVLARRLAIRGQVQGVGFRAAMQGEARALGIAGWVRNRHDGSVEAWVQGAPGAVYALIGWAARGPATACVVHVEISPERVASLAGFEVRPTA